MIGKFLIVGAIVLASLHAFASRALLDEVATFDKAADRAVAEIKTTEELKSKQSAWRKYWIDALGGLPEKTSLNARVTGRVECDGFRIENIIFESQPGVYVTAHLALPSNPAIKPPYPVVMMPLGHSDIGILNPRYATLMAMTARAGFAAFTWDPVSQGERRQATEKRFDYKDNCSTEHTRLGFRGWLVGWNFARFRIWDALRAVDYVESRKDLDCSRLGVMGTSGGGTMSAFMQAFDSRIKVAIPNCYISSVRAVYFERGCHDAEQFFWNMLPNGFNHAAILAMGQPRVACATASRWKDYFPHKGTVETFAVFTNMTTRLGFDNLYWHFSCDGPHGLPPSTRQAQLDWIKHCILRSPYPKNLCEYHKLDGVGGEDPATVPFLKDAIFCTPTHQVRDLPGFRSIYSMIADEAKRLAATRKRYTREELREIVRRRAVIRPLEQLGDKDAPPFKHTFGWWYLKGREGMLAENETAILATIGRTRVGVKAESIIRDAVRRVAANGGKAVPLDASGPDCIAAAHAYAAEPQLFSSMKLTDRPPSWTEMVVNPDPSKDSYAVAVWGALREYDWVELIP